MVDALSDAVYPSEAEGLLYGIVIPDAGVTGCLPVGEQPDLRLGPVVGAQPRPPFGATGHFDRFGNFHEASCSLESS